jgi:pimeloyl-ACP methyl ester carboxylesterase
VKIPWPVRYIPTYTFNGWLTPPPVSVRVVERDRVATADLTPFVTGPHTGFEVGSGTLVLALHGWGGRPAQMAPMARRLASDGFRVVVPELPGHAGGEVTDIKQAAAAVRALVDDLGMPELVVGHSFASMVMRLVFAGENPDRIVLFAPALNVEDALRVFGDRLDLMPWARSGLRRRLQAWDPVLWPTVSNLLPDQFPGADMLLVHDPGDGDTPFSRSAELAALRPDTSLHVVTDVGHSKILSDPGVLDDVSGWVKRVGAGA